MRICFTINGRTYCFTVPIIAYPIHPPKPDPEHKDYEGLISDATILGSIRAAANQLSNAAAKETLNASLSRALEGVQKQAGSHVALSFEN
ncbi:MAG TPA: hypothetical protein VGG42_11070 [Acidobacteriaceae bacterium]|jgi:hypothetical protein